MRSLLQSSLHPEILQFLQGIAEFSATWENTVNTQRALYATLQKTVIITSAGASTRIEGAKLSDEDIIKRLSGLTIQSIRDRDEAEVAGYIDCKKYIFDQFEHLEISEHTIRSLHHMLMAYLPDGIIPANQRGAYKNITNSVVRVEHAAGTQEVIFETTPPGPQTETAMHTLVQEYRECLRDSNFSDIEVIAALIIEFLAIHPFRDGNGRMSRLLTDLCLLKRGYHFCMYSSHEKVIEDSKEQYYIALRQTQSTLTATPDINPWFLYFVKVLHRQTQFLGDKIHPQKPGTLTTREQQVYDLIKTHQPVTIGFLERESAMARVTLKSILARLKAQGILTMEGAKKGSRYRLK